MSEAWWLHEAHVTLTMTNGEEAEVIHAYAENLYREPLSTEEELVWIAARKGVEGLKNWRERHE